MWDHVMSDWCHVTWCHVMSHVVHTHVLAQIHVCTLTFIQPGFLYMYHLPNGPEALPPQLSASMACGSRWNLNACYEFTLIGVTYIHS